MQPVQFDYSPLTSYKSLTLSPIYWLVLIASLACGLPLMFLGTQFDSFVGVMIFAAGLCIIISGPFVYSRRYKGKTLYAFAKKNGMEYLPFGGETGSVFDGGQTKDVFRSHTVNLPFYEIGNFWLLDDAHTDSETLKVSDLRTKRTWGFVRIRLPRNVPHILIDAKANNNFGINGLPFTIDRSQKLNMGNAFDSVFDFYAPLDYGMDANYLFPPHVLQYLLDAPEHYDIEMRGYDLYIYSQTAVDFLNKQHITQLIAVAQLFTNVFQQATKNYKNSYYDVLSDSQLETAGQNLQLK